MKKVIAFFALFSLLGFVFYLDSSTATLTKVFRSSIRYTPDEVEAFAVKDAIPQTESHLKENSTPTFENILEKKEVIDGYLVETYREYEIYSDEKGNVVKKVPTSHLDFLRYVMPQE